MCNVRRMILPSRFGLLRRGGIACAESAAMEKEEDSRGIRVIVCSYEVVELL